MSINTFVQSDLPVTKNKFQNSNPTHLNLQFKSKMGVDKRGTKSAGFLHLPRKVICEDEEIFKKRQKNRGKNEP